MSVNFHLFSSVLFCIVACERGRTNQLRSARFVIINGEHRGDEFIDHIKVAADAMRDIIETPI